MSYVDSFSFEWRKHSRTQVTDLADAIATFQAKTGITSDEMKGKTILDVGCGAGRFTQIAAIFGGKVIGVDMSDSVAVAIANTRQFMNSEIRKADLHNLPFKDNSFDIIFSIGVLHHTPNTRKAFQSLYRLLKPGGIMAIWVYSNEGIKAKLFNFITGIHRLYTTRMNHQLLYLLCYLSMPLYYLHRIPVLGYLTMALFPCSMHPKAAWRVLDTFDWYSPKYQWKHSYKEVEGWFRELGFKDIRRLNYPIAIRGIK